jgi:hypothetical protein
VHDRCLKVQWLIEAEALGPPAVRLGLVPVLGCGYTFPLDVLPPCRVPELLFPVAPVLDELDEGLVGDGDFVYEEVREVHDVGVPFVVEGPDAVVGTHDEFASRDKDHLLLNWLAGWERYLGFWSIVPALH